LLAVKRKGPTFLDLRYCQDNGYSVLMRQAGRRVQVIHSPS
jgi:hypothetical protein